MLNGAMISFMCLNIIMDISLWEAIRLIVRSDYETGVFAYTWI